jgi:hypothetical protein
MSLLELQAILDGLGVDLLEVIAMSEGSAIRELAAARVHAPVIRMACAIFQGLASEMIAALSEVQELDGSEVRPEWADALRRAIVKRVVQEVHAVVRRRATIGDIALL